MTDRTPTRLRVDLAAFDHNIEVVRRTVAPAQVMMVVKNDAYGHGTETVVRRAIRTGIEWIGCLDLATALHVRAIAGPGPRALAWLLTVDDDLRRAVREQIDLGIGDAAILEAVAAAALSLGRVADVHLKADTGLNRNGVRREEWPEFVARARALERAGAIEVVGVFSHISEASDADDDAARQRFEEAIELAHAAGLRPQLRHLAASAAGFQRPSFDYDLVRIGAFLYGISPSGGPSATELGLEPIASLRTAVAFVRGDVAVLPVGAWTGLPSIAAGKVTVAIAGHALPVIAIGEDWMELDAQGTQVAAGDEAVVYGSGIGAELSSTGWAEAIDTIGEEIQVRIDPGIARVYVSGDSHAAG